MKTTVSKILSTGAVIKSRFFQNVATMLAGNVTAQVVAFLAAPVITRIYSPDAFGSLTFIQSIADIFIVIASLRYTLAIVLPKDEFDAYNLLVLSVLSTFCISAVLLLIILVVGAIPNESDWFFGHGKYLLFIPIIVLLESIRENFIFVHTRFSNFKLISASTVAAPMMTAGVKIFSGLLLSASAFWLIAGNLAGTLLSALILIFFAFRYILPGISKQINLKRLKKIAIQYYRFPLIHMPTSLINSFSQNLPVFLFSWFFSPQVVGFYGLANMVLRRPLNVISGAVANVFLQKSAESQDNKQVLYHQLKKATVGLATIGIIPFLILAFYGAWIFGLFFGEEWSEAGLYSQILSPWLFLMLIKTPANQVVIVRQLFFFDLIFNIFNILIRSLIVAICFIFWQTPVAAMIGFSYSGVVLYAAFIIYIFWVTRAGTSMSPGT